MNFSKKDILDYKKALKIEFINLGAKKSDFLQIKEDTVINYLKQNKDPKDVAWALVQ